MATSSHGSDRPLRSFGRTGGRPLSPRRAALIEDRLPGLIIPTDREVSPSELFGFEPAELWLEIGFGGGEHLAHQARANPQAAIIGAEPFVEGQAKLVAELESRGLKNVRIHPGDIRGILSLLPRQSLDRAFILFPDPWPKQRHRKRRLVQPEFLCGLSRTLKPGARVRFATDIADYAEQALAVFLNDGRFAWSAQTAADWRDEPPDHFTTRYQSKKLGDCEPVFLDFRCQAG